MVSQNQLKILLFISVMASSIWLQRACISEMRQSTVANRLTWQLQVRWYLIRRTKRRHAEAEGLEETVAMAGYETAYGGYFSEGPSGFYTAGACSVILLQCQ